MIYRWRKGPRIIRQLVTRAVLIAVTAPMTKEKVDWKWRINFILRKESKELDKNILATQQTSERIRKRYH